MGRISAWTVVGALVLLGTGCSEGSTRSPASSGTRTVAGSTVGPAAAAPTSPVTPRGFSAVVAAITAKAEAATQNPGLQVYVGQGTHEASLAVGAAVVDPKRPMTPRDRLMVASATKPIVATAVMQLVEQGKLTLDDPVEKWLGDAVPPRTGITVEDLLAMRSGLADYGDADGFKGPGTTASRDLVALVKGVPLQFEPGTEFAEVNTNFAALGVVLERVTRRPLAQVLATAIFTPAEMTQSTLGGAPTAIGALQAPPSAPVHPSAAAGVVSTARDLGRFLTALTRGRLVARATLATMTTKRSTMVDGGYGLGLVLYPVPCGTAIGHFGSNDHFASGAFAVPETGRVVAVTANSRANDDLQSLVTFALCA